MNIKDNERIYTLSIATEKEILKAERLQAKLYNEFESVIIKTVGLCKIEIHASQRINN
jgi:hypothetical protein